jgi:hypothetical protein
MNMSPGQSAWMSGTDSRADRPVDDRPHLLVVDAQQRINLGPLNDDGEHFYVAFRRSDGVILLRPGSAALGADVVLHEPTTGQEQQEPQKSPHAQDLEAQGAKALDLVQQQARAIVRRLEQQEPARARYSVQTRRQFNRSLTNVPDGTRLTYRGCEAEVWRGQLHVDGEPLPYDSPTPAAMSVNGGVPVNGWTAWCDEAGATLADVHARST